MCYTREEISKCLRCCESFTSAKKPGLQIANIQITNPQITKKDWVRKSQILQSVTFADGLQI
jgi:hypothetical protein